MPKAVALTRAALEKLAARLRREADAAHAEWPQYVGHWDDWRVAQVTRKVSTKQGVAFEAGDLVLVAPAVTTERVPPCGKGVEYSEWPERAFAKAYSHRNAIDTNVLVGLIREVVPIGEE